LVDTKRLRRFPIRPKMKINAFISILKLAYRCLLDISIVDVEDILTNELLERN
jgi:hypothetical protein